MNSTKTTFSCRTAQKIERRDQMRAPAFLTRVLLCVFVFWRRRFIQTVWFFRTRRSFQSFSYLCWKTRCPSRRTRTSRMSSSSSSVASSPMSLCKITCPLCLKRCLHRHVVFKCHGLYFGEFGHIPARIANGYILFWRRFKEECGRCVSSAVDSCFWAFCHQALFSQ